MTWLIVQEKDGSAEYNQVTLKGKQVSIPFEKIPFSGVWELEMASLNHHPYQINQTANIEVYINGQTVQGTVQDLLVNTSNSARKILDVITVESASSADEASTKLSAPAGTIAYIRVMHRDDMQPLLSVQRSSDANTVFEERSGVISSFQYGYVLRFSAEMPSGLSSPGLSNS